MTNAIKALAQWKESIPQDGLLDFVLKVILALIVYFIGTKLIGWLCKNLRKHLVKFGSDEAAKSFLLSGIKIGLHLILILTIAGNLGVDKTSVAALVGSARRGDQFGFAGWLIQLCRRTDHHVPAPVFRWRLHHRKWGKDRGNGTEDRTVLHHADDHRQPSDRDSQFCADKRQYHECNGDGKKKTGDQSGNFL